MRYLDRMLSVLLILGSVGHTLGSLKAFRAEPMTLFWSLCTTLFILLLAAINLLRVSRPGDAALAWICTVAGVFWIVASLRFGQLVGNVFDFRGVIFAVITLGLCGFSIASLL